MLPVNAGFWVIVGLIVLACVATTNWASGFAGTPFEMQKKAEDVASKLRQNRWPETARSEPSGE